MSDVYELPGLAETGPGGGGELRRSVNLIPITTCSPRFVDLPTALINDYRNAGSSLNTIVTNLIGGHNLFSLDGIGLMYPPK